MCCVVSLHFACEGINQRHHSGRHLWQRDERGSKLVSGLLPAHLALCNTAKSPPHPLRPRCTHDHHPQLFSCCQSRTNAINEHCPTHWQRTCTVCVVASQNNMHMTTCRELHMPWATHPELLLQSRPVDASRVSNFIPRDLRFQPRSLTSLEHLFSKPSAHL